ncbi:NAD(P)(+) transhydrogenase (Re/Si-specific) subunit beta [Pontibacter sp. G13]|uniref:NAD(P)(+) transhydrogenase (Re/Si-specific) subunit beta n=1 Tax=Pontibacter sp. G13 TaxID=3074898 RepID=UPI00288BA8B8|nr:NAD(P)(+) transhydrogenase (Re/Si-specific) subunit beta [Pontibacter sp. G13]WNJ21283.1 NAD(P)(+) transhydrogenase (Re/Si-specific) subunit beta [Pontibacter sp. G13]
MSLLPQLVNLGYLSGVIMFIIGLRQLSSPKTARKGNLMAALGMGIAILVTLFIPLEQGDNNFILIFLALAIGTAIGLVASKRVEMTAMPQMVSIFNGLGGACAVAIALIELLKYQVAFDAASAEAPSAGVHLTTLLAMFVGAVAFTGSLIAYGKLQGLIRDSKFKLPQPTLINMILMIGSFVLIGWKTFDPTLPLSYVLILMGVSLIYGITFVLPIGGADMPVVISLLNAFTGVAAALAGIVYANQVMLVGGILVGSSGTILTVLMCQAMNRSLINVIIGGFGGGGTSAATAEDQVAQSITLNDAAILLTYSESVVVVPGYGMAVAQAQKVCHELEQLLEENGVSVKYAIHPVAGRMPGHMNVLLAEADVSYDKLMDLDDSNQALADTDVVVVVGANDVVNPAAKEDAGSPIYGMPILDILQAKHTIVLKRSMSPGYAGIQNPLFFDEKNRMLFGDAKKSLQALVSEVKSLA